MKSISAIKKAVFYSISGIRLLLKERAFKQELFLGLILGTIEFFRHTKISILLYIIFSYIIVLITESLNSAIETVVDRIGLESNDLSKKAKDIGSAAVFIAIIHLAVIWIMSWFL
jgi:diacylglycerol kinase (ATP)